MSCSFCDGRGVVRVMLYELKPKPHHTKGKQRKHPLKPVSINATCECPVGKIHELRRRGADLKESIRDMVKTKTHRAGKQYIVGEYEMDVLLTRCDEADAMEKELAKLKGEPCEDG